MRRWAHRAQLARVVISCGKQRPSAWAEETKKRELTRRQRLSTVTAQLFRVLNTFSDPFHAQYVPQTNLKTPCELHLLNVLRKGVVNVRYL